MKAKANFAWTGFFTLKSFVLVWPLTELLNFSKLACLPFFGERSSVVQCGEYYFLANSCYVAGDFVLRIGRAVGLLFLCNKLG